MTENKIIHLKTGETIQILDIYPDYLTDKNMSYIVIKIRFILVITNN